MNQLANPNTIYVGQILQLAVDVSPTIEPPVELLPTSVAPELPLVENTPLEAEQPFLHVVQRGETLFRIATSYGLTVNDLVRANDIADPTRIFAGQELLVPGVEAPQIALDLSAPFTGIEVVPQVLVEGKTARFRISTANPVIMNGTFLGRDINIASEENQTLHTILQGIPLFTAAGIYPLNLIATNQATGEASVFDLNIEIVAGPYGHEAIQLLADRGGLLDPAVEENELDLLRRVMSPFTEPRYFTGTMGLPAAATIISPFGTRRSYNGSAYDRFHSGTDFAGAPGTPVLATAPGRVVLADTLNIRGMATIIDHGWGIYTGYWHQSQQYVQVGEAVTAGQVIGTIGSTGRVTGAHLHWELWVSGVPVDPMQWVRQPFM
jgi:murein DD-endopeptidase MepM/ murein hydrolase activator NlpD